MHAFPEKVKNIFLVQAQWESKKPSVRFKKCRASRLHTRPFEPLSWSPAKLSLTRNVFLYLGQTPRRFSALVILLAN